MRPPLQRHVAKTSGVPRVETVTSETATGTSSVAKNNAVGIVAPLANSMMSEIDATHLARKKSLPLLPAISRLPPPSLNRKPRHRAQNSHPPSQWRSNLPPRSLFPLPLLNRPLRMTSALVSETHYEERPEAARRAGRVVQHRQRSNSPTHVTGGHHYSRSQGT